MDSFGQISVCAQRIRSKMGMNWKSETELKTLIGLPAERLFDDHSPDTLVEAISMFRNELIKEIEKGNATYPGAVELLIELRNLGISTAVATSKPNQLAVLVIKNSALNGLLDHIQGVDGFAPKPNPEVILRCQATLPATKYLMVGDRPEDIQAGLASNCFSVGIAQGIFGQKELKVIGANETFSNIQSMLESLNDVLSKVGSYEN